MEMYQGQLKSFDTFLKETGKKIIGFEDINLALIKEYVTTDYHLVQNG